MFLSYFNHYLFIDYDFSVILYSLGYWGAVVARLKPRSCRSLLFESFCKTHDIKPLPTGPMTPWPNRAETVVRLFKKQFGILARSIKNEPFLLTSFTNTRHGFRKMKVTVRQICRHACAARNSQLMIGGKSPIELAYGRKPRPIFDVEAANPEQTACHRSL